MILYIFCLLIGSAHCQNVSTTYTLAGDCPDVKLQENLDGTRFSGLWYNIASFASDNRPINDCATMEFQEDYMGFTLRETYIDTGVEIGNRTQKSYFARVDPTFDAGNRGKFVISYENGDNVLQFPVSVLTSDYDDFAILYTCKNMGRKAKMHYLFTWVLTRSKEKLEGEHLKKVENALSKYTELAEHRSYFVFKNFSEASCAFNIKQEIDSFSTNFW
ncbi:Lopap [Operophtera brumata]|uniref:Lopap n=1 Tax=Operophtera brumata TaxID=104452 RepID=A0A0L7KXZ8_OPEBR|nr:Lopap [Operophtera brumata]